jgi:Protein of unknown function (DUF3306)
MAALGNFLSRWTRRKRKASSPKAAPLERPALMLTAPTTEPGGGATHQETQHLNRANFGRARFNLQNISRAPITDTVDIRGLLGPGVSAQQARTALRQAWASDPEIRKLIDIAEAPSNFNEPKAEPRFTALRADRALASQPEGLEEALDQVNKVTQAIRELTVAQPAPAAPGDADRAADLLLRHGPHGKALPQ